MSLRGSNSAISHNSRMIKATVMKAPMAHCAKRPARVAPRVTPLQRRESSSMVQAGLLLRNSLLEPRVWIFGMIFGNFRGTFWLILVDSGASRPQKSIPDDLMDLGTQNENSGACLRPDFGHFCEKCEQFLKICNFENKKLPFQSLYFLSGSFLSGS